MTPPAQEAVIERAAAHPATGRLQLRPGDLILAVDVSMMVAVFWLAKIVFNLDNSMAVFAVATFAAIVSPHAHRTRLNRNALDDTGRIVRGVCIAYVIASAASAVGGESMDDLKVLLVVAVTTVPALLAGRAISYAAESSVRRRSGKESVLLVGAGDIARRVVTTVAEHEEYGLEVVGALDDDPRLSADELGTRVLGRIEDLPGLIAERGIEIVMVTFSATEPGSMVSTIRAAQAAGATVWVVPRFFELGSMSYGGDHLWGLPVVRLASPATWRPQWVLKRALDLVVATVGLLAVSPLLALVAIAILLETGRPLLFRQTRIGRGGKPFDILKFRSMTQVDRDRQATEWCSVADARVTKVGRFIRATGLDELPQLVNVLRGEMSLVGPRPERPVFVEEFSSRYPAYAARHRLPAGVTGWSQINGLRGDTSIEERAVFDNYYIENWSLSQDLKIILRTFKTFLKK